MPNKPQNEKQRRSIVEFRAAETAERNEAMVIEGKAISFDSPTLIFSSNGVDYFEQIDRHALDNADISDTCLRYNHRDTVPILARMRGGSLMIDIREDGVYFRAELFNTTSARDCYELVRQGVLQCSFGFILPENGGYTYDADTHTRTITRIDRLIDLSIVDIPAYKDTFVSARDLFSLDSERQAMLESIERRRRELIAMTF